MWTVTFYSYKGGVGRSLTLARTARELARHGAKVFVLDLDLEAPGQHFKLLDDRMRLEHQRGFVDFADRYLFQDELPAVTDFVLHLPQEAGGEIILMTAGGTETAAYWERLSALRWGEIVYGERGDGIPLFLSLKEQIAQQLNPDVLLIDARTGITEVGEIALTLLADQVVCLFANNPESLWGVRAVIDAIRLREKETGTGPQIVPVLTRYPRPATDQEERDEEALRAEIRAGLGLSDPPGPLPVVLHSDRDLEVKEDRAGTEYAQDYDRFFDALRLRQQLGLGLEKTRLDAREQEAERLEQARALERAEAERRSALQLAEQLEPGDRLAQALQALARTLIEIADGMPPSSREAAEPRRDEAERHLARALALPAASPAVRAAAAREYADLLSSRQRTEPLIPALDRAMDLSDEAGEADDLVAWLWALRERRRGIREPDAWEPRIADKIDSALIDRLRARGDVDAVRKLLLDRIAALRAGGEETRLSLIQALDRMSELLCNEERFVEATSYLVEAISLSGPDPSMKQRRERLAQARRAQGYRVELPLTHVDIKAPALSELPRKRPRPARDADVLESFQISLETVTPILGGAAKPRTVDEVDVIRVPSVRGHLRFWWRALYGGRLRPEQLAQKERQLWGGAADDAGGRSQVEILLTIGERGAIDPSPIRLYGQGATPGAYALFPARETRGEGRGAPQETAQRRRPGTRFEIELRCPGAERQQVEGALRAWILFGGYGGRTRRGLGSLTVIDPAQRARWLPRDATREALTEGFGADVLAALIGRQLDDLPLLAGAGLRVGKAEASAEAAWTTALSWLSDFRQGQPAHGASGAHDPAHARDRGDARRPGRSNWPEADKVRRLSGRGPWAHPPLHSDRPAWPRAGFGLPIISQFQRKDRNNVSYRDREPEPYEIRWQAPATEPSKGQPRKEHDRLASPLIVKALPLADGRFAPCALWLYRGYPDGQVALKQADPRAARSTADFDLLVAPGDSARFAPLAIGMKEAPGRRLRAAFFEWLRGKPHVQVVAP